MIIIIGLIAQYQAIVNKKSCLILLGVVLFKYMDISFKMNHSLISELKELDNDFTDAYVLLQSCSEQELIALHKYSLVSMIGASTRIENAQLTDAEINWIDTILTQDGHPTAFNEHRHLIENKLSKDRERSIEEVAGCRDMLLYIYESFEEFFPLKEKDLRGLHQQLLNHYACAKPYIGKYKTQSNSVIEYSSITNKQRVIFETAAAGPITQTAMFELIKWYNETLPITPWPIAVSCEFVYRFLSIHPFQDGNGRLGRGLLLMSLLNSKSKTISYVAKYIPIDRFIEKYKQEYYLALNRCSSGKFQQDSRQYKIEYFLKFMIKVLKESIRNISTLRARYAAEQTLSETAHTILNCFREYPEIRLTTKKIQSETKIPQRTVSHSLSILVKNKLIQRYGQGSGTRYQLIF